MGALPQARDQSVTPRPATPVPAPTGAESATAPNALPANMVEAIRMQKEQAAKDEDARSARTTAVEESIKQGAKNRNEHVAEIRAKAETARHVQMNMAPSMRAVIDGSLTGTGAGAGLRSTILRWGSTWLGLEFTESQTAEERMEAIANQMAMTLRSPDGPTGGLPGSASDRDVRFLQASTFGLDKSPGTNFRLMQIQGSMNAAALAKQEAITQWYRDNPDALGLPDNNAITAAEEAAAAAYESYSLETAARALTSPTASVKEAGQEHIIEMYDAETDPAKKEAMLELVQSVMSAGGQR